jgi:hypothetical protein
MLGTLIPWFLLLPTPSASTPTPSTEALDATSARPDAAAVDPEARTLARLLAEHGPTFEAGADATLDALAPAASEDEPEEPYPNLYRRFSIGLGGALFANFHTTIQVNGNTLGTEVNMESLLGLDDSNYVGRLDGEYAFNKRHRLAFSYYDINREGERTIANSITIGDVVIPAGPVSTEFDTQIFKLAYVYDFVTDTRTTIGASFGFHVMGIDTSFETTGGSNHRSFRVDAPLPVLGLRGAYALSRKWTLSATAELLQFDIGDYRGFVGDNRLTLDHDAFEHFGWGVGFNGFEVNGDFEGNGNLGAELDYGYQGVFLYLRSYF